mmetsp:Transcript_35200/g.80322  ORF Transcript_35200/g.80322 Transcript_35200/m.80322 type:complete len:207 (+) Transcript_35200:876-1496(+)
MRVAASWFCCEKVYRVVSLTSLPSCLKGVTPERSSRVLNHVSVLTASTTACLPLDFPRSKCGTRRAAVNGTNTSLWKSSRALSTANHCSPFGARTSQNFPPKLCATVVFGRGRDSSSTCDRSNIGSESAGTAISLAKRGAFDLDASSTDLAGAGKSRQYPKGGTTQLLQLLGHKKTLKLSSFATNGRATHVVATRSRTAVLTAAIA